MITNTLSITEALDEHRSTKKRRCESNSSCSSSSAFHVRPIDVTVIVLSIQINHGVNQVTVMVGDASLENHECARLFIKDRNTIRNQLNDLRRGDVIRVNNVGVKNDYIGNKNNTNNISVNEFNEGQVIPKTRTQKLTTIVCDFTTDNWTKLHDEQQFVWRICKIIPNSFGSYDHVMESSLIPTTTNDNNVEESTIKNIIQWYQQFHECVGVHNDCKSPNVINGCRSTKRRQKIKNLKSSNILCDVIVCVEAINEIIIKTSKHNLHRQGQACHCVMLSEESGIHGDDDVFPFILYYHRKHGFFKELQSVMHVKQPLLISNVLTQSKTLLSSSFTSMRYHENDFRHIFNHFDQVLIPTAETTITKFTSNTDSHERDALSQAFLSQCSRVMGQFLTQNYEDIFNEEDNVMVTVKHSDYRTLKASIVSIQYEYLNEQKIVASDNIRSLRTENQNQLLRMVSNQSICGDNCTYRPSIITLLESGKHNQSFKVSASSRIMSILYGDVDPHFFNEIDGIHGIVSSVLDLLQCFICDDIELEWKLSDHDNVLIIEDVQILSLELI